MPFLFAAVPLGADAFNLRVDVPAELEFVNRVFQIYNTSVMIIDLVEGKTHTAEFLVAHRVPSTNSDSS